MTKQAEQPERIESGVCETSLDSWEEFLPFVANFRDNALVYRGQADARWKIESTLDRLEARFPTKPNTTGSIPEAFSVSASAHVGYTWKPSKKRCEASGEVTRETYPKTNGGHWHSTTVWQRPFSTGRIHRSSRCSSPLKRLVTSTGKTGDFVSPREEPYMLFRSI